MKNKFKKIMATTIISATALSAIGCATTNTKIAQKINNGVNDFVSSINKLDYVDTNNTSSNLGKIVSAVNDTNFISKVANNTNIENTITRPSERTDNFKLFVLSDSPYISLASDDNSMSLSVQFSTQKIETTSDDISEKINKLILKRAILMVYVNEIYNGNVNLTDENRKAINAYVNVIKENASFLNGNRGMVKNQLGMASDLISNQTNDDMVNFYIIKSGEALEIRSNKIDSTISAINSIITILEQNLTQSSCFYQNSLTNAYDNMLSNLENSTGTSNENTKLAKEIAESINLLNTKNTNNSSQKPVVVNEINNSNITNNANQDINKNNQNNITTPNPNKTINQNISNNYYPTNQISNNNNNKNNITTLEEKTQNRAIISENHNRNNEYLKDFNNNQNLTPSQRARLNRMRNRNRARNNSQIGNNSNTQNGPNNPTMENQRVTPDNLNQENKTIRAERTPERLTNTNNLTTLNQSDNNHATRVPYKVTSTSIS